VPLKANVERREDGRFWLVWPLDMDFQPD